MINNNSRKYFIFFACALFIAMFVLEKINDRFWLNDFKVFYLAAKALFNNEQVYGIAFGLETGFYKYSPFTLLLFAPFTLFSFDTASIIYFFINTACVIATILLLSFLMNKYVFFSKKENFLPLLFILLCALNHLVRELHLGNTNMILLFLLSLSLLFTLESKFKAAGLLLAVVILTKPYFLICILPLLLFKKYKTILYTFVSIFICVIASAVISGFSNSVLLYSEWLSAMKEHSNYLSSRQTVFALAGKYLGVNIPSTYGIYFLGLAGILLYIYFGFMNKRKSGESINTLLKRNPLVIYFYLLIAIIPSILITDIEHFLFSLPLITILILWLSQEKKYFWIVLFVVLMFMYGGNTSEIFGKYLAEEFEDWGLLGLSNLIIIVSVLCLNSKKSPELFVNRSVQAG